LNTPTGQIPCIAGFLDKQNKRIDRGIVSMPLSIFGGGEAYSSSLSNKNVCQSICFFLPCKGRHFFTFNLEYLHVPGLNLFIALFVLFTASCAAAVVATLRFDKPNCADQFVMPAVLPALSM